MVMKILVIAVVLVLLWALNCWLGVKYVQFAVGIREPRAPRRADLLVFPFAVLTIAVVVFLPMLVAGWLSAWAFGQQASASSNVFMAAILPPCLFLTWYGNRRKFRRRR